MTFRIPVAKTCTKGTYAKETYAKVPLRQLIELPIGDRKLVLKKLVTKEYCTYLFPVL